MGGLTSKVTMLWTEWWTAMFTLWGLSSFCSNQHSSWHHQSATRSKQKVSKPAASRISISCLLSMVIHQLSGGLLWAGTHVDPLLSVYITAKWQTPAHRPHWLVLTDAEGSSPAPAPPSPWAGVWHCLSFSLVLIRCLWPEAWVDSANIRLWFHGPFLTSEAYELWFNWNIFICCLSFLVMIDTTTLNHQYFEFGVGLHFV